MLVAIIALINESSSLVILFFIFFKLCTKCMHVEKSGTNTRQHADTGLTCVAPIGRLISSYDVGYYKYADYTPSSNHRETTSGASSPAQPSSALVPGERSSPETGQIRGFSGTGQKLSGMSLQSSVTVAVCLITVSVKLKTFGVTLDALLSHSRIMSITFRKHATPSDGVCATYADLYHVTLLTPWRLV